MGDHADNPASARLEDIKVVCLLFRFIHHQTAQAMTVQPGKHILAPALRLLIEGACWQRKFCLAGQQQQSESHYQAAWRMQQWAQVEAEGIAEDAAMPFHQAFCRCLKVRLRFGLFFSDWTRLTTP